MAYTLDICNTLVQLEKTCMRTVHILAWAREKTRFATAFRAQFRILSAHAVHIGSRRSYI